MNIAELTGDEAPMTVGRVGEEVVLETLRAVVDPHNSAVTGTSMDLGPGDDAALLTATAGAQLVLTTDTMSEGQDFRREWWLGSAELSAAAGESAEKWAMDIGTKAAAQNLSDINAMGAVPTALLVSLTLPADLPVQWVKDFYRGVIRACQQPGAQRCVIAGGDLGTGDQISVTITAVGELPRGAEGQPAGGLRRSGATAGDVLAICGPLGRAAAGLAFLEMPRDELTDPEKLQHLDQHADLLAQVLTAQQRPTPPLTAGPAARAAGATAAMDISDGLLRDAGRLARSSEVRIEFDDDALLAEARTLEPIATAVGSTPDQAFSWVLGGGEEYALLATFPAVVELPEGFRRIGTVADANGAPGVITGSAVENIGWDSLA